MEIPPKFVTLPLEVRNEIYSHVFHYSYMIPYIEGKANLHLFCVPVHNGHDYLSELSNADKFLALLEVSHQISIEAATYFYGNTIFCGEYHRIAAFVKSIDARRRDLIKRVEIRHLASKRSRFGEDDTLELLRALPKLRTARITASVRDFTRFQNRIIQSGTWEIDDTLVSTAEKRRQRCRDAYSWAYRTQWKGGNFKRTLLPESPGKSEG